MTDITELALLVSKAKASVFTLKYISQFEPADIDSDDVDLRFEADGRDTGTNVSIVDECGQAAKVIGELVEALEKAQSANEYLREQSAEWERKAISNFEDCAEMSARIEELESQRKLAFAASNRWADKFREAEQRIAELESRTVKLPEPFELAGLSGGSSYYHADEVDAALTAQGIKVEAE
ncbi:ead/Ea22-like family protein [Klebsiella quasivariicola]|uniref:ead/Ea22-like family protein n=1 Tax=Klebsiella quasivariicola TaxID=2026240 RepID=UPI001D1207F7|nr:ead/Ea22-like family protein [Klebsiella quasivariicola]